MSTAVKVIFGVALGAGIASGCIKLAATRSRNAAPTLIRYTAPYRFQDGVQIVEMSSTSLGTMNWQFDTVGRLQTES